MSQMISPDQQACEATETVAVIIPTLNEGCSIGKVIEGVPVADLLKNGLRTSVYVIDGRSNDKTREIAVEKGAEIILEDRQGKGSAVQTAFKSITADYEILVDGDNTYPIEMAIEMVRLLKENDVVIGSRLKGVIEPGAMTKLNVVGNVLLSLLASVLFGARVSDVCTGFWGYRSDAIRSLKLTASGFEIEADMFVECVRKCLRVAEIPITYRARKDQPKLSSLRDGVKIGFFLCKRRLRLERPKPSESETAERSERPKPIGGRKDVGH
jgi:glycosyltransferase involved in cell wall biosynthesis